MPLGTPAARAARTQTPAKIAIVPFPIVAIRHDATRQHSDDEPGTTEHSDETCRSRRTGDEECDQREFERADPRTDAEHDRAAQSADTLGVLVQREFGIHSIGEGRVCAHRRGLSWAGGPTKSSGALPGLNTVLR